VVVSVAREVFVELVYFLDVAPDLVEVLALEFLILLQDGTLANISEDEL